MSITAPLIFFRDHTGTSAMPPADKVAADRPIHTPPHHGAMQALGPPSVSVVVPTYRRPEMLKRCLAALMAQSLPSERYEIIVCDDEPGAATRVAVDAIRAEGGQGVLPALRYLPITTSQGPAGARNAGWRTALSPIIAFTDDDTVPDRAWLESGLDFMSSTNSEAAAGRVLMPIPERPTDQERDAGGLRNAEFATANCFVRVEALEKVGGFDERFKLAWREDSDLHFSLIEHDCRIGRVPQATVTHPLRPTPFAAGLSMQRKIMFDVLLYRKHRLLYRRRIRSRPPWFYLVVTGSLVAAILAWFANHPIIAAACAVLWLGLSAGFFCHRLRGTVVSARNIGELLLTSLLIPPLAIFWRLVGMLRFGWGMP